MKTTVLIVDDKEENIYMLESLLKGHGFEVTAALNGKEALEEAIKNPPEIIISDILMPVMDGFTLCKKWRSHEILKNIPFVFYTATYTDAKDEEFALHLGADRFILKPAEPEAFMMIINDLMLKLKAGKYTPVSKPQVDEEIQLREYNQALIRKLEDKMTLTEEQLRELHSLNAELQNKIEELQQWKNITLGREDRVVELKKEVNILLKQLGKSEKYKS